MDMKPEVLSLVSPFCSLSMPLHGFIARSTALPTTKKIYKRVHSLIDIYCNPFLLSLFKDTLLPYFVCLFKEFMSCLVMIVCLVVLVTVNIHPVMLKKFVDTWFVESKEWEREEERRK